MAKYSTQDFSCPECGRESEMTLLDSINTADDPGMKGDVLSGKAFVFKCPGCGREFNIDRSFLYDQPEDKFMIFYLNDERGLDDITAQMTGDNKNEWLIDPETGEYRKRIVRSYNSLKEKILIFDKGLDDRVMEVLKVVCYTSAFTQKAKDKRLDSILFVPEGEVGRLLFYGEEKLIGSSPISRELYDNTENTMKDKIEAASLGNLIFDFEWAYRLLSKKPGNNDA